MEEAGEDKVEINRTLASPSCFDFMTVTPLMNRRSIMNRRTSIAFTEFARQLINSRVSRCRRLERGDCDLRVCDLRVNEYTA